MSAGQDPTPIRRGLAGRVLGGRYRVTRMVSAGANTLIADAEDLEVAASGDGQARPPGVGRVGGVPRPLRHRHAHDVDAVAPAHRRRLRLGRGGGRQAHDGVRRRRAPLRRQPARPVRPRPISRPVAGAGRRPGGLPRARLRPPRGPRAHRADPVQARVRRRPPAAHRRLRPRPAARRRGLERTGHRCHPRRPLQLARAGARPSPSTARPTSTRWP